MSPPTPKAELFAWHTEALENVNLHLEVEATSEPQCGFFQRRLVKGGPFVPARIWMEQPTGEDGELDGDEVLRCEVHGRPADPEEAWQWLCGSPISEEEFNFMTADLAWVAAHGPHEPKARPREAVDWSAVPIPQFNKEHTP